MDLDIDQDDTFQTREWTFNRIGWVVISLFVLAGLAGLLGPGPFSWVERTGDAGLLTVEYQRMAHLEADDVMTVTVAPDGVTEDSVTVVLPREWVAGVDIDGITPTPESETSVAGGLELEFAAEPGAEVKVQINYRPSEMGRLPGSVAIDGDAVSFNQFVIP